MVINNPMLELVETYEDVVSNVVRFNNDLDNETDIINQLSQFRKWYYIPEVDKFGPSKYIGYKNMNCSKYNRGHRLPEQKRMGINPKDGRITTNVLNKWFKLLEDDSNLKIFLDLKLKKLLERFGKKPNKLYKIYIPKESIYKPRDIINKKFSE